MNAMQDVKRIDDALERIAANKYSGLDVHWCCDRIEWLARFRKVSKTITDALAEKATAIMDGVYYGDEPFNAVIETTF